MTDSGKSLRLEKVEAAQCAAAERVLRAAFTSYVRKLGRELTADAYAWLGAAVARGDVYAALEDDAMVAVVATTRHGDDLSLDQVAVDPTRQRGGIGGWLLDRIETAARADGVKTLSLDTADMMTDLQRLYGRHGFRAIRRGPPAHGKDAHLRVFMGKAL